MLSGVWSWFEPVFDAKMREGEFGGVTELLTASWNA
jgi:hypothetical protein